MLTPHRDAQFEDYEIAQVSGRIASTADSSVPVLDASSRVPRVARIAAGTAIQPEAPSAAPSTAAMGDADAMADGAAVVKTEPDAAAAVSSASRPKRALAQRASRPALPLPTSLFIGDLRLLALKAHLGGLGVPAEFAGEGVLMCGRGVPALLAAAGGAKPAAAAGGDVVAVRKAADGVVWVEGAVNDEYYRVRDAVYGSFAQVTVA